MPNLFLIIPLFIYFLASAFYISLAVTNNTIMTHCSPYKSEYLLFVPYGEESNHMVNGFLSKMKTGLLVNIIPMHRVIVTESHVSGICGL